MPRYTFVLVALTVGATPLFAQTSRIAQVRQEMVRDPDPPEKQASATDSTGDSGAAGAAIEALGFLLTGLPALFLEDNNRTNRTRAYFLDWPHADAEPGYMTDSPELGKWWAARVTLDGGSNFDDLNWVNGQVLFETSSRLGLSLRSRYFNERNACTCHDEMVLTTIDGFYRFAEHPLMQWYIGFGANILAEGNDGHGGVNITYGFDLFPVKPLILSATFDLGSLGDETVWRMRGSVGANFRNVEIMTGYDWLRIGDVTLDGPFVGLRLWF